MEPGIITQLCIYASELKISDANEASTRFKLIDSIIFDLLGWQKADVEVEERLSEDGTIGFIDYTITAGAHSFVIEAKRIGVSFGKLPHARKALMSERWAQKGPTNEAIAQAKSYGRARSVGFCIVTNGLDWIIYPINRRDKVAIEDSNALVFQSIIFSEPDQVAEFCSALSRESVIAGSLETALLGTTRDQIDTRRLNKSYDKSFSRVNRKSVFSSIEREIITAFNESLLTENIDLLKTCYVKTPERTRFDQRIQMYLNPREQILKNRPIRPVSKSKDRHIVKNLFTETRISTKSIALLTIGLVGSGKTTFLDYVSKISSENKFNVTKDAPDGCWIYADFRDFSVTDDPKSIIVNSVFDYVIKHPFLNNYSKSIEPSYAEEIESLKTGPLAIISHDINKFNEAVVSLILKDYNEKLPYARKIINNTSISTSIFLVIDNVDQIESVESQSSIFLEATAIARILNCNLILAMRDVTYVKNKANAVFDAFDFDAVYIDPPDIKSVLSKRFSVAAQLLKGKRVEFDGENGVRVVVDNAKLIIDMLSDSVLGTEVGRIIEVAATGDTRLALKMTRQFLQYGYSSTGKAIGIYQRTGRYRLPPHEALRAIMLGNQNIYRENLSVIGNPFDSYLGESRAQFLRVYIMGTLVLYSSESEFDGISIREVFEHLENIGISRGQSKKVIEDLIAHRFFYTKSQQTLSDESIILPSRLCGYIVRDLCGRMVFLETAMFDTFISDGELWSRISSNVALIYRERNFHEKFKLRRNVTRAFFNHCKQEVEKLSTSARERGLPSQWCSNPLVRIESHFNEDMNRASDSASRNYGPQSNNNNNKDLPLFGDDKSEI